MNAKKQRKKRRQLIIDMRQRLRTHFLQKREIVSEFVQPRYDDVFRAGVEQLDAADSSVDLNGQLIFDQEVCKSRARNDPDQ